MEALKAHPPTGVSPRLTAEQKAQIPELKAKGAEAYGFRGDVWTASRVAEVIKRTDRECAIIATMWGRWCGKRAGVDRNQWSEPVSATKRRSNNGRRSVGRTSKKAEQDKATINGARWSRVLSAADGSPHLGPTGTNADSARQVDARSSDRAISGITLDGRVFMQVRPDSYDAEAVVGFLRVLLRKISGKIVLIWDGSPIHRAHQIKDFLKRGAAKRQASGTTSRLRPWSEPRWGHLELS